MSRVKQTVTIIVCLAVIITGIYTLVSPDVFIRYVRDENYSYTEEDGALTLTKYNGDGKNIIVPSEIKGKPVKAIKGAFCNNHNISNVKVSRGIEAIDYMSFYGCVSLLEVTLPDSLKSIEHAAFCGCISLEKVKTGKGLKEIMPYAFSECTFLKKITLPDGLKFIGKDAFSNCRHLEKIKIPASVEIIGGVTEKTDKEGYLSQRGSTENTAFDGCDALKIEISDENPFYSIINNVISRKGESI